MLISLRKTIRPEAFIPATPALRNHRLISNNFLSRASLSSTSNGNKTGDDKTRPDAGDNDSSQTSSTRRINVPLTIKAGASGRFRPNNEEVIAERRAQRQLRYKPPSYRRRGAVTSQPVVDTASSGIDSSRRIISLAGINRPLQLLGKTMLNWGYGVDNGPAIWPQYFAAARETKQSPIDIETAKTQFDPALAAHPFKFDYHPNGCNKLTNNGFTWMIEFKDYPPNEISGGATGHDTYRLKQIHAHWGDHRQEKVGSEHLVDGKQYDAEIHLVHWNRSKFNTFEESARTPGGLTVLGVFVQSGASGSSHHQLDSFFSSLKNVSYQGDEECLEECSGGFLDPSVFLPTNKEDFWCYDGSLTTPPCYQSVNWVVFKEPVTWTDTQMGRLNRLHFTAQSKSDKEVMACNFRPPQPLNDRVVRRSFEK